jgi:prepilin-type N-terminal cleavage/methylation domain-containing protein
MRTFRSAFTLMEMMLVLAIMGIILAVSLPTINSYYGGIRARAGADTVRAAWMQARLRAMEEGRAYRFAILPGESAFRVAPDDARFWAGGEEPAAEEGQAPPLIMASNLPRGVVFTTADEGVSPYDLLTSTEEVQAAGALDVSPEQFEQVVVFLPDGTADQDVSIVFRHLAGPPLVLNLRGLTCTTTATRPALEGR